MIRRRRILVLAAALAAAGTLPRVRAQSGVRVEGGTPLRLPRSTVDDLGIELVASDGDEPIDIAVLTLGPIEIASGRLAAADAIESGGELLAQAVPPGRYPFQLVVARFADETERIAFAQVKFADQPAASWSNALFEEDQAPLGEDELSGYEVNSGFGSVFDARALQAWHGDIAPEQRLRQLEVVLRGNQHAGWTWARVVTPLGSGYIVSAGTGEGFYGSYWGKDASGTIVSLVTDFDLLDWAGLPESPPVTA